MRKFAKMPDKMEILIENIDGLDAAAMEFASAMGERRHFAFRGNMGAGKTTFIAALCRALGSDDDVSSPTFAIINEYHTPGRPIYHFDFYRIDDDAEAMDLGLDDYFDSDGICLMEWPENVENFLPEDTVDVSIEAFSDGRRVLRF